MGLTQIFLNKSRNNSVFSGGFDSLKESFGEIENQCLPFYYRLARFVATTLKREVALEEGFEFNEDGEPEFSKKIYGKTDKYLIELCEVNEKTLRNWRKQDEVSVTKREERKKYFKLAFKLNLNAKGCNTMFNKLFGSPAFIREPETMIYLHCLDNSRNLGFDYADNLVKEYNEKIKTVPAMEIFERMYTENIYNYPCKTEEEFVGFLILNRKQFEIANFTAISKIEDICQKYITKDCYAEKLKNIEALFEDYSVNISDGWSSIEYSDESLCANEPKHSETTRSIMECFPLFLSVLAKDAPDKNGQLINLFAESAGVIDLSVSSDEKLKFIDKNTDFIKIKYLEFLCEGRHHSAFEKEQKRQKVNALTVSELDARFKRDSHLKQWLEYCILQNMEYVPETSGLIEMFSEELNSIDIKNIDSYFFRRAFLNFPSLKLIYDKKLNDPDFSKFIKYENIRKLLIMMAFLEFHTEDFNGTFEDNCNIYLAQCGFGELYAPNPFDFMFLLASNAEKPIDAFRTLWDYAFSLGTNNYMV